MTKRPGFTLIELLIVIMIVVVLTSIGINAMVKSQATFVFNGALQQVQSMVREARSLAVTGKSVKDTTDYDEDSDTTDSVTPAHYGVHFDPSNETMTLFADMHGIGTEGVYDPATDLSLNSYDIPDELDLLADDQAGYGTTTVLYTPIFADTEFADDMAALDLGKNFFVFGLKEIDGDREICYAIHPVAGIPETTDATGTTCP